MRVAARQLRAILYAAAPLLYRDWARSLHQELGWLGRVLGPARDLDVQLAYMRQEATSFAARDRMSLRRFIAHLESEREHAQEVLLGELTSPRYANLIKRLQASMHHLEAVSPSITLRDLAARTFKKFRKTVRRAGKAPNHAALHDIRIKIKRALRGRPR